MVATAVPTDITAHHCPSHMPSNGARFVVCTSKIISGLTELEQMVTDLGGRTINILNSSVTHLVAGVAAATKCVQASEASIPIVQESWVRASWMLWKDHGGASLTPAARDSIPLAPLHDHRMPPLRGQVLCVTGQGFTNRPALEQRIANLGGKYMGSFDPSKTTLLLCDHHKATGAKVTAAVKFETPVVTVGWLDVVEKVGAWRKFDLFYVDAVLEKRGDRISTSAGVSSASSISSSAPHSHSQQQQQQQQQHNRGNTSRSSSRGPSSTSFSSSSVNCIPNTIDPSQSQPHPAEEEEQHNSATNHDLTSRRSASAPPDMPLTSAPSSSTPPLSEHSIHSTTNSTTNSKANAAKTKEYVDSLQHFVEGQKKN